MASRALRPLGIGEILDAGIKVLTRHWKVLMICVVGLVGPMNVLQVLLRASIDPNAFKTGTDTTTTSSDVGPALAGLLGSAVLTGLAFLVAFTACFKAVADAWLGAQPEVGRSLRFGARRLGPVLGTWILWSILIVLAFIALIVPGIYVAVALCLTLPVLLFEGGGPFHAFGRSRSLVKGRWWPTFGLLLVGYLLVSILGGVIQGILVGIAGASSSSVVPAAIATVVGATVSNAITTPYLAAVLTILYFDMRVRKEGFDLQLMAEELGGPHDPDAPIPAPLIGDDLTPEQRAAAPFWPPPPGWTPPPVGGAEPEPAHAGWEPPSADAPEQEPEERWRPRTPAAQDEPDEPWRPRTPAAQDEPDEPWRPRTPAAQDEPDEPWRRPAPPPAPGEPEAPPRDPRRADWLPPEAPRGPGGL